MVKRDDSTKEKDYFIVFYQIKIVKIDDLTMKYYFVVILPYQNDLNKCFGIK